MQLFLFSKITSFLIVLYILQNHNQGTAWIFLFICLVWLNKFYMSLLKTELAVSDYGLGFCGGGFTLLTYKQHYVLDFPVSFYKIYSGINNTAT